MTQLAPLKFAEVAEAIKLEKRIRAAGGLMLVDTDDRVKLWSPPTMPHALKIEAKKYYAPLRWLLKSRIATEPGENSSAASAPRNPSTPTP